MRRIYSALTLAAVHHARNLLEVAGIRAEVRNEFAAQAMGELPMAECWAEVWVREIDAERAAGLLREALSPQSDPSWACASCGETLGAQFTQCWSCGSYRSAAA